MFQTNSIMQDYAANPRIFMHVKSPKLEKFINILSYYGLCMWTITAIFKKY